MKIKYFLMAIAMMLCTNIYAQKSMSSAQQNLRSSILSYLRSEGYQPSIDEDGDIKFKRQGDVYFVIVSNKDESPMYVALAKYFTYGEKFTKSKINLCAEEINKYKMIKLMPNESSFMLHAEMYLTSASAFTNVFTKMMEVMEDAEEELTDM